MIRRSEAKSETFEVGRGVRIGDPIGENIWIGDSIPGVSAKCVGGRESCLEEAIVQGRVGKAFLDLTAEAGEDGVGDPAKAFEPNSRVGIIPESTHPLFFGKIFAAQGNECPELVLRGE